MVTTECIHCSFDTTHDKAINTTLNITVPCGNTYIFTVRAVINGKSSKGIETNITTLPTAGAVTKLAVKFIPGKNESDWIKKREDALQLTWNPPNDHDKCLVGNLRLKKTSNLEIN